MRHPEKKLFFYPTEQKHRLEDEVTRVNRENGNKDENVNSLMIKLIDEALDARARK